MCSSPSSTVALDQNCGRLAGSNFPYGHAAPAFCARSSRGFNQRLLHSRMIEPQGRQVLKSGGPEIARRLHTHSVEIRQFRSAALEQCVENPDSLCLRDTLWRDPLAANAIRELTLALDHLHARAALRHVFSPALTRPSLHRP